MRLWPRKRDTRDEKRPAEQPTPPRVVTDETRRAIAAAREAAVELHEARRTRANIDRRADEIDAESQKNGFRILIHKALGSGT